MKLRHRSTPWIFAGLGALSLAAFGLACAAILFSMEVRQPRAATVRWSDLDSRDPQVLAANLRAIGCPEATIAKLVSTTPQVPVVENPGAAQMALPPPAATREEVAMVPAPAVAEPPFAPRLPVVPNESATVVPPANAPASVARSAASAGKALPVSASALARMARSATPASARYVTGGGGGRAIGSVGNFGASVVPGSAVQPTAVAGASGQANEAAPIVAPEGNVAIPAAFAESDSSTTLTGAEQAQLAQIQDQFVNDIGGTQRDPGDSQYRRDWRDAQWKADELFKTLFGYQAFLARQTQQNLQASRESASR